MHEHNEELIMALAEETLDETAAAAASVEISACAECAHDLELQRIAVSALGELPSVYLTAVESSQLHAGLLRELSMESPLPAKPKRSFAWARWLPAAGIAAVFLVAIVSLPFLFGGGDDDSADMTMMAAEQTTNAGATETTAAASAEALPPRDGALDDGGAEPLQAAENEEMAGGTETAAAPETTEAADYPETTTTTGSVTAADVLPLLGHVDELDRETLIAQLSTDDVLVYSTRALTVDTFVADCVADNSTAANAATLGLPEDSNPVLLGVVFDDTGEEFLLVAYVPDDVEDAVFVTQRRYSCDIVAALF